MDLASIGLSVRVNAFVNEADAVDGVVTGSEFGPMLGAVLLIAKGDYENIEAVHASVNDRRADTMHLTLSILLSSHLSVCHIHLWNVHPHLLLPAMPAIDRQ